MPEVDRILRKTGDGNRAARCAYRGAFWGSAFAVERTDLSFDALRTRLVLFGPAPG